MCMVALRKPTLLIVWLSTYLTLSPSVAFWPLCCRSGPGQCKFLFSNFDASSTVIYVFFSKSMEVIYQKLKLNHQLSKTLCSKATELEFWFDWVITVMGLGSSCSSRNFHIVRPSVPKSAFGSIRPQIRSDPRYSPRLAALATCTWPAHQIFLSCGVLLKI